MQLPPELSVPEQEIIKQHQVEAMLQYLRNNFVYFQFSTTIQYPHDDIVPPPPLRSCARLQEAERRRLAAEAKVVAERRIKVGRLSHIVNVLFHLWQLLSVENAG